MFEDPLGEARLVGGELQVGAAQRDQLGQLRQAEQAVCDHDLFGMALQVAQDQVLQLGRHGGLQRDADHRAASALAQQRLELAHQVLGLLLDLQVAVADDLEDTLGFDLALREQPVEEQRHQRLHRNVAALRGL